MKARGLVFDLFGGYLLERGGEVRLRALIALMECFAIPEATVRVVVARLRKEGWLASHRDGRETTYHLTEPALHLVAQTRERLLDRTTRRWDGQWHMVIYSVPETERGLREQLRRKLCWLGFGPLSSSVWLSAHDRLAEVEASFADRPEIQLDTFRARSKGLADDQDIAARCWDLDAVNQDYADMLSRYQPRLPRYRAGELTGREALVERVHLLHEYRSFPHRDPDLPVELLPADWRGSAAREVFLEANELLRKPAEEFVDELLAGLGGSVLSETSATRGEPPVTEHHSEHDLPQSLRWLVEGTELLLEMVERLPDERLREPSALPNWTRAHVVGHLARNAEALTRLASWARTGVESPMYPSREVRDADIEESARYPTARLRAELGDTAKQLAHALEALDDTGLHALVRSAQGRTIPASEIPWMRVREVWLHAVDLAAGARMADLPADLLDELLDEVTETLSHREGCPRAVLAPVDRDRTWWLGSAEATASGATPVITVRGTTAELAGWLVGREPGSGLSAHRPDGGPAPLPTPPRWL